MALTNLRRSFAARAAAVGLGALAAFTPLSASYADSAGTPPVLTVATAPSALTQEQRARVDVLDAAREYARDNPGHIGVSVLRGPDAEEWTATQIAQLFSSKLAERHQIGGVGYAGDNGLKGTEISFHYLMVDTDNQPLVRSMGPYNIGDAINNIDKAADGAKARALYSSLIGGPSGQD